MMVNHWSASCLVAIKGVGIKILKITQSRRLSKKRYPESERGIGHHGGLL